MNGDPETSEQNAIPNVNGSPFSVAVFTKRGGQIRAIIIPLAKVGTKGGSEQNAVPERQRPYKPRVLRK